MLLLFTPLRWVNRKDRHGCHIYHGGFLGMDNISCVNRSDLPHNTTLDQVCMMSYTPTCCHVKNNMSDRLCPVGLKSPN